MLQQLNVQNFALIQQASLNFGAGYTVITGETGSGKSILLHALQLILGERADFKVIGASGDKAIVEGVFSINSDKFSEFFSTNDIDFEKETIVRREITKQGKSRAFINDTPVSLAQLKEFTEQLVSIHSQYNTLELKRKDFQFNTLDTLASTDKLHQTYLLQFNDLKKLQKEIAEQKELLFQSAKEKDYNDFQLAELSELNIEKNDFSALEEQLQKVENANEIQQLSQEISQALASDEGVIAQLQQLKSVVQKLARLDKNAGAIEERIASAVIELKDINEEMESFDSAESINEEKRLQLMQLVDQFNHVLSKHRCANQEELLAFYKKLQQSTASLSELEEKIVQLEQKEQQLLKQLNESTSVLHESRKKAIPQLEAQLAKLLVELKLPDTQLVFDLKETDHLHVFGKSQLAYLFSANKGFSPVEIEKAASGGELSRVMLALQQLISEKVELPTIFFDEIDTGVSGDVAQKIGNLLHQMGKNMQLFAISHLPQVAAKADFHLKVEKSNALDATQTTISVLNETERIEEIARLMSGEIINEAAIANAKALMN